MSKEFVKYMQTYIEMLTGGQNEYLIAIVDIERELADEFLKSEADDAMAWFDRKDYSEAVVLRNDKERSKIVLFSNDSVKMIDSLKDFVEYPAIVEEKDMFWKCLTAAFGQEPDHRCKKVLDTIMESRKIALKDLFEYLHSCLDKNGSFEFKNVVTNLYQLDLWTYRGKNIEKAQNKQNIKRLIRNSDPLLAEAKLMSGIAEKKVEFSATKRRNIIQWLSRNDLKSVFKNVPYDEKIESLFRGSVRRRKEPSQEKQQEQFYANSYEYAMQEMPKEHMKEVESILSGPEKEALQNIRLEFSFPEEAKIRDEFSEIKELMELLSLTEEKKIYLREKLRQLQQLCIEAMREGREYTPACLWNYAKSQEKFVSCYFALMGRCLSDKGIARMCIGVHFLSRLQMIFCQEENGQISMPFYHPLAGAYLIFLQRKYEQYRELLNSGTGEFWEQAVKSLLRKEAINFPVRYMLYEEELYQLDYGSVQNMNQQVVFLKMQEHTAGSWVNIRLLNEDLLNYMERQKYLSEIQVTVVDINDISEIMSLTQKLKGFAESERSMIHKIVLNIVSSREEALKKQLQENMEMDLEYPKILFRFTRDMYRTGKEYDMESIIRDSDLLFLADSSILYQRPGLREWNRQANKMMLAFEEFDLLKQSEEERQRMLEILWYSMHFMELHHEVKLAFWDTKELNQSLLNQIRQNVGADLHRTVVILSSNPQLMQHLYHLPEFQIRHSILSGQEMVLVNFHAGSHRRILKEDKEAAVTIPLKPFLESVTGLDDMKYVLYDKGEVFEVPYLTINYQEGRICFRCRLYLGGQEDSDVGRKEHYSRLIGEMCLLCRKDQTFRKKFLMMLYEETDNIPTALMLDYLYRTEIRADRFHYEEQSGKPQKRELSDVAAVIQFQEMLRFIRTRNCMDEYAVHTFAESDLYQIKLLEQCIAADRQLNLLDEDTRKKMQEIYTKLEEKNE